VRKIGEKEFEVDLLVKDKEKTIKVNTILVAIGRDPHPEALGLQNTNIHIDKSTQKILGRKEEPERTNIDHIYAVGDIVYNVPELMPVALKSGKLLAKRLSLREAKKASEQEILRDWSSDYKLIPTTVFSTTEYSFVGLSEDEAISKYGGDDIEVYHRETTPLQFSLYKEN
jgi:pyruvate/2-oxoglutarate dehydrogenase complex dihydrolipoamide dehydrogenase (E3) component